MPDSLISDISLVDILIVGSGVAGCSTAIAVKQLMPDRSILMVERSPQFKSAETARFRIGETLVPQAMVPLQQLGLWEQFTKCKFLPAHGSSAVWGSGHLYHNEFILSPYGHGWHLNRPKFDRMLLNEAINKNILINFNTTVSAVNRNGDGASVLSLLTANGSVKTIQAKFIVDATGRNAAIAKKCGASKIHLDKLVAIYKFFKVNNQQNLSSASLVESFENGWWYSAFLPGNKLVAALMTDADLAKKHAYSKSLYWQECIMDTEYTGDRLDSTGEISDIQISPAHSQHLDQYCGDGWLAVGDAANCYDPLSSAGIFKALMMGRYASFAIADYFKDVDKKLAKYQSILNAEFNKYLKKKEAFYLEEKRFPNVFWERRKNEQTETQTA